MSNDNMSDQKAEYYLMNSKLCRLVQSNPCMYDRSSPHYLKKEQMDRAWNNIAREVNDTVVSCKERWRNIRTAYARSVNIYKTPCGPNRHKRYYLHNELQFLAKHLAPGLPSLPIRILTPTELEQNHENNRQSIDESDDNCTFQITIDSSSPIPPPVQEQEQEHVSTPEPDYVDETPLRSPNKRRRIISDEFQIDYDSLVIKKDLDSEFLLSLLPEMKTMNARQKITFKGKIFQVMAEVFSDSRDFPQKVKPSLTPQNSFSILASGKKSANRNFSNEILIGQRERQPEGCPQNSRSPSGNLNQSQNESSFVKQERINVEVD